MQVHMNVHMQRYPNLLYPDIHVNGDKEITFFFAPSCVQIHIISRHFCHWLCDFCSVFGEGPVTVHLLLTAVETFETVS